MDQSIKIGNFNVSSDGRNYGNDIAHTDRLHNGIRCGRAVIGNDENGNATIFASEGSLPTPLSLSGHPLSLNGRTQKNIEIIAKHVTKTGIEKITFERPFAKPPIVKSLDSDIVIKSITSTGFEAQKESAPEGGADYIFIAIEET